MKTIVDAWIRFKKRGGIEEQNGFCATLQEIRQADDEAIHKIWIAISRKLSSKI